MGSFGDDWIMRTPTLSMNESIDEFKAEWATGKWKL
jgi:hypothetical protein